MRHTLITAHSGADGTPDNYLNFVEYALTTEADALEVDVLMTDAGVLALGHDTVDETSDTLAEVLKRLATHPTMRTPKSNAPA